MRKILFILNYRAGTNLWNYTNGKKTVNFFASLKTKALTGGEPLVNPEAVDEQIYGASEQAFWLPTVPQRICPCENYFWYNPSQTLMADQPFDFYSWHVYVGDWWGEVNDHTQVPGPYDLPCATRFGPQELLDLPGDDWKFIQIVRDGRNQSESLRRIPGGIEQAKHETNATDYFHILAKGWRNRARMALDCNKQLSNFHIVKFEDYIKDCANITEDIYEFAGLPIDKGFVQRAFDLTIQRNVQKQHSSFGSGRNIGERWHSWTDWEKETFQNIAGQELQELGYL